MKGPKIKLNLTCHDCDYLDWELGNTDRPLCQPICKKLDDYLEIDYAQHDPIPSCKCPYKKEALRDFYLKQITPKNNGATILKVIRGEK